MRMKKLKKAVAVLLSFAMILGMMPAVTRPIEVQAATNTAPDTAYWTDVDGLKSYNMTTSDPKGRIRFGKDGDGVREWAICGVDTADTTGNSLALLSTSQFGTAIYGSVSKYSTSDFVGKADEDVAGIFDRSYK